MGLSWESSLQEALRKLKLGGPAQLSLGGFCPLPNHHSRLGLCVHHNCCHQFGLDLSSVYLFFLAHFFSLVLTLTLSDPLSHSFPTWHVLSVYIFSASVPTNNSISSLYYPFNFQKEKRCGRDTLAQLIT